MDAAESKPSSINLLINSEDNLPENLNLSNVVHDETRLKLESLEEISNEHNALEEKLQRVELSPRGQEQVLTRKNDEERRARQEMLQKFQGLRSVRECLLRVIEDLDGDDKTKGIDMGYGEELKSLLEIALEVEMKMKAYKEINAREKTELVEENRDVNRLLQIALAEKEAVEKSLNSFKREEYSEQKVATIFRFAERGLQRLGFGFVMGMGTSESSSDHMDTPKPEASSESEEKTVSLASTMEKMMNNLRLEITLLRRSLEESRSDTERLQILTEKQAQELVENTVYIKELENRDTLLTQNVEELLAVLQQTEEEVARWREACELEVEAGKRAIEERDKMAAIFGQELAKTKAALNVSDSKLKLKEELAEAAIAAQAAAERSLKLADSRASELRERTEELFRQLEAAENRMERGQRRRVRHICWPWHVQFSTVSSSTTTTVRNVKRVLPEMQALIP